MGFILSIQADKAEGATVRAIQPPTVSLQGQPSLGSIPLAPRSLVCSRLFGYDRLETDEFDCASDHSASRMDICADEELTQ